MAFRSSTLSTIAALVRAAAHRKRPRGFEFSLEFASRALALTALGFAVVSAHPSAARAQEIVDCPDPESQNFIMPPEFVSSDGIMKGTIYLIDEKRRLPRPQAGKPCRGARVRVFVGEGLPLPPPAQKPLADYADAIPGPTLRARVGDLVQLRFVNKIDPNNFDRNFDIEECTKVGRDAEGDGSIYPRPFGDTFPNCLHASSTANIHFHGTHTTPNGTGDNVYLQVRPLPRNSKGDLTTDPGEAMAGFEEFFKACEAQLQNPLNAWPATWGDVVPTTWIDKQKALLVDYQQKNPGQRLWDENQKVLKDSWPIYYVGAFPYCFALPAYTVTEKDEHGKIQWPPAAGHPSPVMGQTPGTHWYHAHKHGSTAVNVSNGMTGAFIIEGKYDKDLEEAYQDYVLVNEKGQNITWSRERSQKVMVLNQLIAERPNAMSSAKVFDTDTEAGTSGADFSVNGRLRPRLKMQPGEVQLWRIVNTSGRTAAYFMPPQGMPDETIEWRQLAQDGVQFADGPYQKSLNRPLYMAPANRVDLLVKAPLNSKLKSFEIRIQNVMARSMVRPAPMQQGEAAPGTVLLTVDLEGPDVMKDDQQAQMPFLATAPEPPVFLQDITSRELELDNSVTRTLVFNSEGSAPPVQHTINGIKFGHASAHLDILLGKTEEWVIKNLTFKKNLRTGIDHPLHIHINPFQVTEFFDPNENLVDPDTGRLEGIVRDGKTEAVPRYVLDPALLTDPRQCYINPADPSTWSVAGARSLRQVNGQPSVSGPCVPQDPPEWKSIWRDVFAIPSARRVSSAIVIPGYYKMRSRFVDYPGLYVMHCHILIHEDRGMMYSVEVLKAKPAPVRHH
jgi:FtsP/CotA-like multicopper oxidase with cupredoxin domain